MSALLTRPWRWLWIYAAVFVAADAALWIAYGTGSDGPGPASAIAALVFVIVGVLTGRLSAGADSARPYRGMLLWLQGTILLAVVVFTAVDGLYFHHLVARGIPLWTNLKFGLFHEAAHLLHDRPFGSGIANVTFYVLIPFIVLSLLRVPAQSLGFGRFQPKSGIIAVVWLTPVVIAVVWGALASGEAWGKVVHAILSNVLQNGASEEFLWRGAIQSRLRLLMRDDLAVLLQAVLFGLWHVGLTVSAFHGNIPMACAEMIAVQTTAGLAMGYLALRSGNIAIGSAVHALIDAV